MSADRPSNRAASHGPAPSRPRAPRLVHARPTGAPPGLFPRRLMRTAKVALLVGTAVAGAMAVLPAPRSSEQFEVAFSDWRRQGAWYADEHGAPADPAGVAPPGPLEPAPAGPVMIAGADATAPAPSGEPRLARLPAGAGGRVRDFAAAPLRSALRRDEPDPATANPRPSRPDFGPVVPPPDFADTPADDPASAKPLATGAGDAEELRAARDRVARDELLEELRGLREDVRRLTDRWERFDGADNR